ncbi:fatty acyl-AMP ligase [Streptomyces sp. LBUM 1477]|nr:hypothetical protein [Streptomyces sp. LBUM 1477]MBP5880825.1 fatty acyl-AMP ligase [Streptomyces sp. LBUM 1477]
MVDLPHATSAAAVIREHALSTPEHTAVIFVDDVERPDGATRWSYAALDAEARRIGAWLAARYPVGTRVLLLYPTGFDFAARTRGACTPEWWPYPPRCPAATATSRSG